MSPGGACGGMIGSWQLFRSGFALVGETAKVYGSASQRWVGTTNTVDNYVLPSGWMVEAGLAGFYFGVGVYAKSSNAGDGFNPAFALWGDQRAWLTTASTKVDFGDGVKRAINKVVFVASEKDGDATYAYVSNAGRSAAWTFLGTKLNAYCKAIVYPYG